ncbi:hypothetical protein SAMD00019534_126010 [Acytostelium subglobosum LB1]|uniref:hypothetical protein n=1 Tax=Acytostelium subglobosum LB1 TaxID=1410327 RepID=UPI0006449F73|nr:hypothetical protein SAMD00019534_126010 [Acytostelium subglobosum LB1]GAM29425.1 hypothetical protein SAMD00019534_126010 [Acytostelium subglobosum LB1]|eukprot:XP_012747630.1 hypothetical protein SAMD00019534_126010 [Acytostelium subglobosum LB1]
MVKSPVQRRTSSGGSIRLKRRNSNSRHNHSTPVAAASQLNRKRQRAATSIRTSGKNINSNNSNKNHNNKKKKHTEKSYRFTKDTTTRRRLTLRQLLAKLGLFNSNRSGSNSINMAAAAAAAAATAPEYKSGYLYKLVGVGIFKYRRKYWFILTRTHLLYYSSQEKQKTTPVDCIALSSIRGIRLMQKERESIQTTYGFIVEHSLPGSSHMSRLVLQTAPISTLADWVVKLDGLANTDFGSFLSGPERKLLLKILYKNNIKGGVIKSSHDDEEWSYSSIGSLSTLEGTYNGPQIDYHWDGEWLRSSANSQMFGAGRFNGVYLAWYLAGVDGKDPTGSTVTQAPDITYFWDEREKEYVSDRKELTFKWSRHFLASKYGTGEWIVEGHVPQPVVMFLQLIKYRLKGGDVANNPFAEAEQMLKETGPSLRLSIPINEKVAGTVNLTPFTKGQALINYTNVLFTGQPGSTSNGSPKDACEEILLLTGTSTSSSLTDQSLAGTPQHQSRLDGASTHHHSRYLSVNISNTSQVAAASTSTNTTPETMESPIIEHVQVTRPPANQQHQKLECLDSERVSADRQIVKEIEELEMIERVFVTKELVVVDQAELEFGARREDDDPQLQECLADDTSSSSGYDDDSDLDDNSSSSTELRVIHRPQQHVVAAAAVPKLDMDVSPPRSPVLNVLQEALSPRLTFHSVPLGSVKGPSVDEQRVPTNSNKQMADGQQRKPKSTATSAPLRQSFCLTCSKAINGHMIVALGNSFHRDCFKCTKCHKELGTKTFYRQGLLQAGSEDDGADQHQHQHQQDQQQGTMPKYLCECCFNEACPVCPKCNANVMYRCVNALGKKWHIDHFCCTACAQPLVGNCFFEVDGKPYCQSDYTLLFKKQSSSTLCTIPVPVPATTACSS